MIGNRHFFDRKSNLNRFVFRGKTLNKARVRTVQQYSVYSCYVSERTERRETNVRPSLIIT